MYGATLYNRQMYNQAGLIQEGSADLIGKAEVKIRPRVNLLTLNQSNVETDLTGLEAWSESGTHIFNRRNVNLWGGNYIGTGGVTISEGWYKKTTTGNFRALVDLQKLGNGLTYSCSCVVYNPTSSEIRVDVDWCDVSRNTYYVQPYETKHMEITAARSEYNATYRFFDIHLTTGTAYWIKDVKVEEGDKVTPYSREYGTNFARVTLKGLNLITYEKIGNLGMPVFNKSEFDESGKITGETDSLVDGVYFTDLDVKPNTEYILHFQIRKIAGTLSNVGGHTDNNYKVGIKFLIDGVDQLTGFPNPKTVAALDDGNYHFVEYRFKTPETVTKSDRLYIQPNRGIETGVTFELLGVKIEESNSYDRVKVAANTIAEIQATLNIALVTKDLTHSAYTNTRNALVNLGHTVTGIAETNVPTTDLNSYDVIVLVRYSGYTTTSSPPAFYTNLDQYFNAGKPFLIGVPSIGFNAQHYSYATYRGLGDSEYMSEYSTDADAYAIDTTHYITNTLTTPTVLTASSADFVTYFMDGATAGKLLLQNSSTDTKTRLIAYEKGSNNRSGQAIPTNACWIGFLYGRNGYHSDGINIINRSLEWVMQSATPPYTETISIRTNPIRTKIQPNKQYRSSVYARHNNPTAIYVELTHWFYNEQGSLIEGMGMSRVLLEPNVWYEISNTITSPANTAYTTLELYYHDISPGSSGDWDGAQIRTDTATIPKWIPGSQEQYYSPSVRKVYATYLIGKSIIQSDHLIKRRFIAEIKGLSSILAYGLKAYSGSALLKATGELHAASFKKGYAITNLTGITNLSADSFRYSYGLSTLNWTILLDATARKKVVTNADLIVLSNIEADPFKRLFESFDLIGTSQVNGLSIIRAVGEINLEGRGTAEVIEPFIFRWIEEVNKEVNWNMKDTPKTEWDEITLETVWKRVIK